MGQKYGVFDDAGLPTAFYDESLFPDGLPENVVAVSDADWRQYLTGQYYRDADGLCIERPAEEIDLATAISRRQARLNTEVSAYIYGIYDAGTQASMQVIYSAPDTPAAVKADIEAVWTWIASIMVYYYARKTAIAALETAAEAEAYTCDFSRFDASAPAVTLQAIFAVIGG